MDRVWHCRLIANTTTRDGLREFFWRQHDWCYPSTTSSAPARNRRRTSLRSIRRSRCGYWRGKPTLADLPGQVVGTGLRGVAWTTGTRRSLLVASPSPGRQQPCAGTDPGIDFRTSRRIVKLSFTMRSEAISNIGDPDRSSRVKSRARRIAAMLGLRSARYAYITPWIGASSMHVEIHAPEGIRILGGRIGHDPEKRVLPPLDPRREHLYRHDLNPQGFATSLIRMRARDESLGIPAITVSALVLALPLYALVRPDWVATHVGSDTPATFLAVASVIAGLLSRPTHEITRYAMTGARISLITSSMVAFAAGARLSLASGKNPLTADTVESWALPLSLLAWGALALLVAVRLSSVVSEKRVVDPGLEHCDRTFFGSHWSR